jgi:glycosyltransferase involved in cell wall biosynthesis
MALPFFSIIIATHSRPALLERAIQSVTRQGFDDCEIIVVSDDSNRETYLAASNHLRDNDIFIKRNGTQGPARSRNIGLELSKGRFCLFLDDDDSHREGFLAALYSTIQSLHGDVFYFDFESVVESRAASPPTPIKETRHHLNGQNIDTLMVSNFINNCAFAMSGALAKRFRFDETLRSHEDWDFLLALRSAGCNFVHIPIAGVCVHEDINTSQDNRNMGANSNWPLDFMHIYRRWPAATEEQREQRHAMLKRLGITMSPHHL